MDGRSSAIIGAWRYVEAAGKLRIDEENRVRDPLPELYWAYLAEARILVSIGSTDLSTGIVLGDYLEREAKDQEERDALIAKFEDARRAEKGDGNAAD